MVVLISLISVWKKFDFDFVIVWKVCNFVCKVGWFIVWLV